MLITQQIAEMAYKSTVESYGHEPTWEEFKDAVRRKNVRVHKTVATQLSQTTIMPTWHRWMYGVLFMVAGFLIIPVMVVLWLFNSVSGLYLASSIVAAPFIIKLARTGQCSGLIRAALDNEQNYIRILRIGAFKFTP